MDGWMRNVLLVYGMRIILSTYACLPFAFHQGARTAREERPQSWGRWGRRGGSPCRRRRCSAAAALAVRSMRVGQSRQRRPGEVCSETKEGARTAAGEATATAKRDTRDVCHDSKVAGSRDAASSSPAQQPIPEGTPSTRWPKQPSDHGLFEL